MDRPLDESGQAGNSTGQPTHGQQNNEVNQPNGGNLTGGKVGEAHGGGGKKESGAAAQAHQTKKK